MADHRLLERPWPLVAPALDGRAGTRASWSSVTAASRFESFWRRLPTAHLRISGKRPVFSKIWPNAQHERRVRKRSRPSQARPGLGRGKPCRPTPYCP